MLDMTHSRGCFTEQLLQNLLAGNRPAKSLTTMLNEICVAAAKFFWYLLFQFLTLIVFTQYGECWQLVCLAQWTLIGTSLQVPSLPVLG